MIADVVAKAGPRALTPDVPEEERLRLAKNERFRKAAEDLARRQQVEMFRRQDAIAKENQAIEYKSCDGIGEKVGSIDAEIWLSMMVKYGNQCWSDPEFVAAFLRDNPACRVKTTRGTRGQEYGGRGR